MVCRFLFDPRKLYPLCLKSILASSLCFISTNYSWINGWIFCISAENGFNTHSGIIISLISLNLVILLSLRDSRWEQYISKSESKICFKLDNLKKWLNYRRLIFSLKRFNFAMNSLIMDLNLIKFILSPSKCLLASLSFSKMFARYAICISLFCSSS